MEQKKSRSGMDILLGCLLMVGVYLLSREGAQLVMQELESRQTVVLDAGHGGEQLRK